LKIARLSIEGAYVVRPDLRGDARGMFMEWYRFDALTEAVGHPLRLAQANISMSAGGVVRGIHFASVPVGQAKYITCLQGALLDVIVDIRVGSPTFGKWETVRLDEVSRHSVYIEEGLGHGFCALTDNTMIAYLCSAVYDPAAEHTVHALDPAIGIEWPVENPQLSARDQVAPTLEVAAQIGLLPQYDECRDYIETLRHGGM
jgi:dTDP-4-dehydrorhamnose 3,5-epimerase